MAENTQGYALDWESEIDTDGKDYLILEEGDYAFQVVGFERKQFPGGKKIPPCKKAELTLRVTTDDGEATCKVDLILYSTMMWKIAEFFRAIGQKKHGQAFTPNWGAVVGSEGRAHFKPRTYEKDGEQRQTNDVAYFYDCEPPEASAPPTGAAPAWNGGKF